MNLRRKLRAHTEVHTGPLNDILFILLLFFLIASTLANPNLVKVNNPRGTKDSRAKQDIIVSITKEHQFFIGQKLIPDNMIDSSVNQSIVLAKEKIDTPSVVINADTVALFGEAMRVMRIAKLNKAKVSFHVK